MEKRTVLAFALTFLVFIIWTRFFGPTQAPLPKDNIPIEKEAPQEFAKTPSTPSDRAPDTSIKVEEERVLLKTPEVEEKLIEIQTPLYKAVFTNVGPTIKSFELKHYYKTLDSDSPLIELVSHEGNAADFFLMNFKTPSFAQHGNRAFETDQKSIRLGPESSPQKLIFRFITPEGVTIRQTFRFYPDQYKIDAYIEVNNGSPGYLEGTFNAKITALPPKEKKGYYSYVGLALLLNGELKELELEEAGEVKEEKGRIEWVAYENDYFISAVMPEDPLQGVFTGTRSESGMLEGTHRGPPVTVTSARPLSSAYALYFGPRDLKTLKGTGNGLEKAIDFGWFDVIAKGLLHLLLFFNKFLNNYGLSIIMVTIVIKILFWPLTYKSYKSMKEMQKLQPIMAKLREKYKDDKQKLNAEMMGLYKTYKVNPLGGCLPMLIQLPVFFALFRLLGGCIELRHAPFVLWINDLSAPDRLFSFDISLPLMNPPYGIPVLTLLMGGSMILQQKMTPTVGDPAQAKMMMLMPVIFTFMFINFPSGLVLYWFVSNIISIGQQYRILKKSA